MPKHATTVTTKRALQATLAQKERTEEGAR
jgi:hypothetical protein